MINTKELRNDAETAHCGHLPFEVSASEVLELLDRLEAAEREAAHVKEVEFPRKVKAVADIWAGKCERLEKENEALRINLDDHRALVSDLRKEVEKLRTKLEAWCRQDEVVMTLDDIILVGWGKYSADNFLGSLK